MCFSILMRTWRHISTAYINYCLYLFSIGRYTFLFSCGGFWFAAPPPPARKSAAVGNNGGKKARRSFHASSVSRCCRVVSCRGSREAEQSALCAESGLGPPETGAIEFFRGVRVSRRSSSFPDALRFALVRGGKENEPFE